MISLVLGKIFGMYLLVAGIGILCNYKLYPKILQEYKESLVLTMLSGSITILFGTTVIALHNIWTTDWRVVITFFGWISFIKGSILFIKPYFWLDLFKPMNQKIFLYFGPFYIFLGLWLLKSSL